MTLALNTDTDRIWVEVCETTVPHVNGVGNPVARVLPEYAQLLGAAFDMRGALYDARDWVNDALKLLEAGNAKDAADSMHAALIAMHPAMRRAGFNLLPLNHRPEEISNGD